MQSNQFILQYNQLRISQECFTRAVAFLCDHILRFEHYVGLVASIKIHLLGNRQHACLSADTIHKGFAHLQ